MALDNNKIHADHERYNAAARALIESGRAATKRDNTPHKFYGELETDTHDKGKVYVALRNEITDVEMQDAIKRGKPEERRDVQTKVELRIVHRALDAILLEEFSKKV